MLVAFGAAGLLVAGCGDAAAAKVYRCGNAYQDLPCATDKPAPIRPADRAAVPPASATAAATPAGPAAAPAAVARAGGGDRLVLSPAATADAPRPSDPRR